MKINKKTYKELIEQDIQWLHEMMKEHCPSALEGKHIIVILEEILSKNNG